MKTWGKMSSAEVLTTDVEAIHPNDHKLLQSVQEAEQQQQQHHHSSSEDEGVFLSNRPARDNSVAEEAKVSCLNNSNIIKVSNDNKNKYGSPLWYTNGYFVMNKLFGFKLQCKVCFVVL